MKLTPLYRNMLAAMNTVESESGPLQAMLDGDAIPLNVTVKRGDTTATLPVVLPTDEVMREDEDGSTIKFHPFAESPFADQSPVFNQLVILASGRLCESITGLVTDIINASLNFENLESYTNKQINVIKDMPAIKKASGRDNILKYAKRVMSAHTSIIGEHPILRFNIGRRERNDIQALRWSEINAIVLDEKGKEDKRIFGIKAPSQAAYDTVMGAFRSAFNHESLNGISVFLNGTDSRSAPYFQSFLKTWFDAVDHINATSKALGKLATKEVRIADDYRELLTEAETLVKEIKVAFEGNVGTTTNKADDISSSQGQVATKAQPIKIEVNVKPTAKVIPQTQPEEIEEVEETTMSQSSKAHPFRKNTAAALTSVSVAPEARKAPARQNMAVRETVVETAPVKKPQAQSSLNVRQPASVSPSKPKLSIQHRVREVHVHDALNQPLFDIRNNPVMLPEDEVPTELFVMATDARGVVFDDHGMPVLEAISAQEVRSILSDPRNRHMGQQPAQPHMNPNDPRSRHLQPQQPQQHYANPNDPRNRCAPAPTQSYNQRPGYGQPQQQQPQHGAPVYRQPISGYVHG